MKATLSPRAVGIELPVPLVVALVERMKASPDAPIVYIAPDLPVGVRTGDDVFVKEDWCPDFKPRLYRATAAGDTYGDEPIRWRSASGMTWDRSRHELRRTVTRVEAKRLREVTEEEARQAGAPPNWAGELSGWKPDEHGFLPFDADEEGEVPGCDPYEWFTAADCILRLYQQQGHTAETWVWVITGEVPS